MDEDVSAPAQKRRRSGKEALQIRQPAQCAGSHVNQIKTAIITWGNLINIRAHIAAVNAAALRPRLRFLNRKIGDVETHTFPSAKILQREQFHAIVAAQVRHILAGDADLL